jgi:perosamine synthetase
MELLYYRGRVALHAILRGLRVTAADEVIVQAYTCAAVIEPLQRLGVTPVYVDIDRQTYTMDLDRLAAAITGRTKAIIVQHTFGHPVDLERVLAIAGDIPVIEDCAHVTEPDDRGPVGTSGVAAFYSYEWGKPVIAGVGGKAVVHDEQLAKTMRAHYTAYTPPPIRREVVMSAEFLAHGVTTRLGVTWRLRALYRRLSRLGLVVGSYDSTASPEYGWTMTRAVRRRLPRRTEKARKDLARRTTVAAAYRAGAARYGFAAPVPGRVVPLRMPVAVGDKDALLEAAARKRIEVGDWFATPVHPLTGPALEAAGYQPGSCPAAEWAAEHVVTLPVRAGLDPGPALDLLAAVAGTPPEREGLRIIGGPFTDAQLRAVAEMHATEVAHGFLSSLGVPALEVLYRHVAASRHCALFLAVDGSRPVGYICGSRDTSALVREFVTRRWWLAGRALLPRLLSPGRVFRAIETLRYAHSVHILPRAEVINFVVQPQARGAGIAQQLFAQLMSWFEAQGETAVKMVTGEQQTRAHGFYRKAGAELRGHTSIHSGTASRVYLYSLTHDGEKAQKTP